MQGEAPVPWIEIGQAETFGATLAMTPEQIDGAAHASPDPVDIQELAGPATGDAGAPGALPGITGAAIAAAEEVPPPPVSGFRALSPKQEAGVGLARFVLFLIGGSIAAVFLCLIGIEVANLTASSKISDELLGYARIASDNAVLKQRLAGVTAVFRNAREQTARAPVHDEVALVTALVADLRASKRLPDERLKEFDACVGHLQPPAGGAAAGAAAPRQAAIDACIKALGELDMAVIGQSLDIERVRLMKEIGKEALDARQTIRSFWLSLAQLVLLNLLLPTLTALLGYIFGTEQAGR